MLTVSFAFLTLSIFAGASPWLWKLWTTRHQQAPRPVPVRSGVVVSEEEMRRLYDIFQAWNPAYRVPRSARPSKQEKADELFVVLFLQRLAITSMRAHGHWTAGDWFEEPQSVPLSESVFSSMLGVHTGENQR